MIYVPTENLVTLLWQKDPKNWFKKWKNDDNFFSLSSIDIDFNIYFIDLDLVYK